MSALRRTLSKWKSWLLRDDEQFELIRQCAVELRRRDMRQRPLYQAHLRQLADGAEIDPVQVPIGYALEKSARKLHPNVVAGCDPARPTLCMVCVGDEFARAVEIGTQTKADYCRKHGYNFIIVDQAPSDFQRPLPWLKISLIVRLLQEGHGSVFFLDADTLVTNPEIPLEPFFHRLEKSGRHVLIAEDSLTLNSGSFFIRRTWQSLTLLDLVFGYDADVGHAWWENYALIELVKENPAIRALLLLETDCRQFNSTSLADDAAAPATYNWQPGDFICHFAGVRDGQKIHAQMAEVRDQVPSPQPA